MSLARGTPLLPFGVSIVLIIGGLSLTLARSLESSSGVHVMTLLPVGLGLVLLMLLLWFFRDPERTCGQGVVSAADGTVTHVEQRQDGVRVNVFMSPLNVHVNRAPLAGRVVSVTHHPGGHVPAFSKDSERNERVVVEWSTDIGSVTTVQIAGSLARRIVPYISAGDEIAKGERFGLIRLGSRLDHHLPAGCESVVRKGDRVIAGVSTIARMRGEH